MKHYIVFYTKDLVMRERVFTDKEEADTFAASVNSEAIEFKPIKLRRN